MTWFKAYEIATRSKNIRVFHYFMHLIELNLEFAKVR